MVAEENCFVTYIIPPFPVQERILQNKTWQDFSEIWWLFLIKQFPLVLVGYEMIIANSYPTRAHGIIVKYGTVGLRPVHYKNQVHYHKSQLQYLIAPYSPKCPSEPII